MDINKIISIVRSLKKKVVQQLLELGPLLQALLKLGDDPPVKKRKRYIYGQGYRKMWMQKMAFG